MNATDERLSDVLTPAGDAVVAHIVLGMGVMLAIGVTLVVYRVVRKRRRAPRNLPSRD